MFILEIVKSLNNGVVLNMSSSNVDSHLLLLGYKSEVLRTCKFVVLEFEKVRVRVLNILNNIWYLSVCYMGVRGKIYSSPYWF